MAVRQCPTGVPNGFDRGCPTVCCPPVTRRAFGRGDRHIRRRTRPYRIADRRDAVRDVWRFLFSDKYPDLERLALENWNAKLSTN